MDLKMTYDLVEQLLIEGKKKLQKIMKFILEIMKMIKIIKTLKIMNIIKIKSKMIKMKIKKR
jgi:hypothetical protein